MKGVAREAPNMEPQQAQLTLDACLLCLTAQVSLPQPCEFGTLVPSRVGCSATV